jgi:hypothetical protein
MSQHQTSQQILRLKTPRVVSIKMSAFSMLTPLVTSQVKEPGGARLA